MKILVCVKQVREPESDIKIDDSGRRIFADKSTSYRMNRFDEFAVEEALLIRETFPHTSIDVISLGPARSAMVVKRALGMGADHGIHIITGGQDLLDPFVVASLISSYARNNNYDLILSGVMAEDDMQGQVGPIIAELLSMPWATSAIFENLSPESGSIYVEREIEGGYRDCLELRLPAVLTVQSGINEPRYPSLSNVLRAKKQDLETIDANVLNTVPPRQSLARMAYPQKSRSGLVLTGSQPEKASKLLHILRNKSLIR